MKIHHVTNYSRFKLLMSPKSYAPYDFGEIVHLIDMTIKLDFLVTSYVVWIEMCCIRNLRFRSSVSSRIFRAVKGCLVSKASFNQFVASRLCQWLFCVFLNIVCILICNLKVKSTSLSLILKIELECSPLTYWGVQRSISHKR